MAGVAAPCPFCGSVLVKTRNGYHHPTIKEGSKPCPITGHHLGDDYIPWVGWQTQLTGGLYATMGDDGYPVFNFSGEGHAVTAAHVNEWFKYLKGLADG